MMKILVVHAVPFGVRTLLLPQINYLISHQLSVEIVCSDGEDFEIIKKLGYTIHAINIDRKITPISNLKSIYKLTKLMRNNHYDLVHLHSPIASVLGRIAAKLAGIKRIVYTSHGFHFHENMPPRQYWFYHTIEKIMANFTDLILTQSSEDFETAIKTKLIKKEKLRYLGNGIQLEKFQRFQLNPPQQQELRKELKIPEIANPIIGITGRLTEEKGYRELIEALAKLLPQMPNIHLLVIGGQLSSERDSFQIDINNLIQKYQLENHVTFTGFRTDIPQLLGLVNVFTLPSYREGLPRSILEAMAMEIPVIATNIRGCREAVVNEKTGLIIPPKNSEKLAEALIKLLTDQKMSYNFGQAGKERVQQEYDENLVFERLAKFYQELGISLK